VHDIPTPRSNLITRFTSFNEFDPGNLKKFAHLIWNNSKRHHLNMGFLYPGNVTSKPGVKQDNRALAERAIAAQSSHFAPCAFRIDEFLAR
jgi:hypothetical protein